MSAPDPTPHKLLESLALGELLAQSQRISALEARVGELSRRVGELEQIRRRRVLWPWLVLGAALAVLLVGFAL